jgi:hypothetical protein
MNVVKPRHLMAVLAIIVSFMVATMSPAAAVAAKFFNTSSSVNNNGSLTVNFDERGLGNGDIDYVLTAHVDATFACINGGQHNPSAANKRTISSEASASGTFQPKNGRVIASLTTSEPTAGDFACPPGQRLVLASVTYSNIILTDTTNGTSTTVEDVTRVFFNV